MFDERFHPAQRFSQREQPSPPAELQRRRLPAVELEGDHAAEITHLPARHHMARVVREPRVEHPADGGVILEYLDDRARIGAVTVHPDREGLDSPQGEPGVERPGDRTHGVLQKTQPLPQLRLGGDERSADHVAVTAQIFGGAVHDDVSTEGKGLLQVRRSEGVVDHQQRTHVAGDLREARDVRDAEQRIGGRLTPDNAGTARPDRRPNGSQIGHGYGRHLDAPLPQHAHEQAVGASVSVVRDDDVARSGSGHGRAGCAEHTIFSGETRGEGESGGPAFEAREALLERRTGRVGRSAVLIAGPQPADAVLRVGTCGVNRDNHGTGGGVGLLARVDRPGSEAVTGC